MPIDRWVGMNRGETQEQAVSQNTDPTRPIQISWDKNLWPDRAQFLSQLTLLENRIRQEIWPQA